MREGSPAAIKQVSTHPRIEQTQGPSVATLPQEGSGWGAPAQGPASADRWSGGEANRGEGVGGRGVMRKGQTSPSTSPPPSSAPALRSARPFPSPPSPRRGP